PRPAAPKGEPQPVRPAPPSVRPPESVVPNYASIDEVPDGVLHEVMLNTLHSCGATGVKALTQTVARQIGFKRTRKNIQARIKDVIEQLTRSGRLGRTEDGRVQIVSKQRAVNS